jgi:hypothetical protein
MTLAAPGSRGSFTLGHRSVTIQRTIVETTKRWSGNDTPFSWKDMPKGGHSRQLPVPEGSRKIIEQVIKDRELRPGDRLRSMVTLSGIMTTTSTPDVW